MYSMSCPIKPVTVSVAVHVNKSVMPITRTKIDCLTYLLKEQAECMQGPSSASQSPEESMDFVKGKPPK